MTDNSLQSDKVAGQNVMDGIHRKSYSEVEEESEGVCGGLNS